jgi:hypothetical protein
VNCTRTGRVCEGYNRGLVFLNRTAQGLKKRAPLEEAQPRDGFIQTIKRPVVFDASPQISCQIDTGAVIVKQFEGMFLESYLPSDPSMGKQSSGAWLLQAACLNEPGDALKYALRALFISRAGRTNNDEVLTVRGTEAYGEALQTLRIALCSKRLASSDGTLAACNVLATYEVSSIRHIAVS